MEIINLHLFVDEKVVNRCIQNFEDVLPGQNKYIVVIPEGNGTLNHVKITNDRTFAVTYGSEAFWKAIGDLRQYKNVIVHLMTSDMFRFVSEHPEANFTWASWGSDLYSDLLELRGYKMYYDKRAIFKYQGRDSLVKRIGRATIGRWQVKKLVNARIAALKNISRICTTDGEYKLLLKYYPEAKHISLVHLGYYPVDAMISKEMMNSRVVGRNIIVGNSAYGHGNHVEVFKKLQKMDLTGRKVIVPLSYGDVPGYILEEGKKLLGDYFMPVVDFMPLEDYNRMLMSSDVFIYGNYRQAAVGNIVVALYIGAKVFLNKKNPLYSMYKERGYKFFSLDELEDKINYQLTEEEIENNRTKVLTSSSYEHIKDNIIHYFS